MKKNDGGSRQIAGMGSAPAPGFARATGMPNDGQLKRPGPGAPDSGQTARPNRSSPPAQAQRQGNRHGDSGGGAKE